MRLHGNPTAWYLFSATSFSFMHSSSVSWRWSKGETSCKSANVVLDNMQQADLSITWIGYPAVLSGKSNCGLTLSQLRLADIDLTTPWGFSKKVEGSFLQRRTRFGATAIAYNVWVIHTHSRHSGWYAKTLFECTCLPMGQYLVPK